MSSIRTRKQTTQQLPKVAASWCLLAGRGLHRLSSSVPGISGDFVNPEAET
jgi:hypothetical protein